MPVSIAIGVKEMKSWQILLKQLFAEFLGTFVYMSLCVLVQTNPSYSNLTVAFANGLLVASIVQIVGNVSGGHLNPAVTLGVMVCGHIRLLRGLCYMVMQVVGSIAGAAVAYGLSESTTRGNLGVTVPSDPIRWEQALGLELLMTFILVSVVVSVGDPSRGPRGLGSVPLAIGLSLTACNCACLGYTGGALNPVRALGPAVVMNIWNYHWVYWVGPMLGGLLAGLVYRFVLNLDVTHYM